MFFRLDSVKIEAICFLVCRFAHQAPGLSVLIGESNVAIVPAIGGYGVEDIYLGEFSPQVVPPRGRLCRPRALSRRPRERDAPGPGWPLP